MAAIVARLVRWLGPTQLDLAEEAVQDALLQAMRTWPGAGVPANPPGWLHRAARNRAIDLIRRRAQDLPPSLAREEMLARVPVPRTFGPKDPALTFDSDETAGEDRLWILLLCCHPALSRPAQMAIALRLGAGLGAREIARAFREPVPTIQQRLVRARKRLAQERLDLHVPADELAARLDAVRAVLFALYSEGYLATTGELTRDDLIAESIRLTSLLADHPLGDTPATHALLAMMLLQTARLPARVSGTSALVPLGEQDRSRWDFDLVRMGYVSLRRAATGDVVSDYHLLADIAACHTPPDPTAPTNWARILQCYDALLARKPSAIVALNRIVALAEVEGTDAALRALETLRRSGALRDYHLFHATDAELLRRAGRHAAAAAARGRAADLTSNPAERAFITSRRAALCQSVEEPGAGAATEPSGAGTPSLVT
ncbi:MAG TPA: DUF6596 domain-containing protein [Thermomicrobiales bacterium]|nr:DUF6596 domain-containing protein [Thermomicrobiales bacterium]